MEVKQAFEYFRLLEQQFWKNLDKSTIDYITFQGELKPEDMLLYGEFGFALVGLKPCVLVEFRDEKTNKIYLETVIKPVLYALKEKTLDCHTLKNIETPESNLDGCILIYSNVKATTQYIEDKLLNALLGDKNEKRIIPEDTMTLLLDYPGHLPSTEEEISTMQSVIYFHNRPNNKGLLALTSFAIQNNEKEKTLEHFQKYSMTCKDRLNIELKLFMQ